VLALTALAAGIRLAVNDLTTFAPADETAYVNYATAIRRGISGYHDVVRYVLDTPAAWPYPSPSRWSAFLVDGLACRVAACDFHTLATVSTWSGIALIPVAYAVGRQLLAPVAAAVGTAFVVTSPLLLGLGRRALQDEFFALLVWLAFWMMLRVLARPTTVNYIAAIVALGLAFGAKDSFVIFYAAFAAMFLIRPRRPLDWRDLVLLIGPWIVWVVGFTIVAGSPGDLVALERIVLGYRASPDSYERIYAGGPVYQPIVDFMVLSPVVTTLAIGGLLATLTRAGTPQVRRLAAVAAVCFLAFAILPKDIRYAAAMAPLLGLAAGWTVAAMIPRSWPGASALAGITLLSAGLEGWIFWTVFVVAGVYDPVLVNVLRALHAVP